MSHQHDGGSYPSAPDSNFGPINSSAIGSFEHDFRSAGYTLRWESWPEMEIWKSAQEEKSMVEFIVKETKFNKGNSSGPLWKKQVIFVCGWGKSGGEKRYNKKYDRHRKIPTKKVADGCKARLTVKTYPGIATVLGLYQDTHLHPVGNENVKFTRLSKETHKEIEHLLRLGVDPAKVLEQIMGGKVTEDDLDSIRAGTTSTSRNQFATRADVRRIQKTIEEELIRLAAQDGASVLEWVKQLRERGHFVELKTSAEPPPANSYLERNSFILIIQTRYQRECWGKHGSRFAGIDATHNTTHYENMSLFTLLIRDPWGQGKL